MPQGDTPTIVPRRGHRRSAGTSNSAQTARQTSRGSTPASRACSTVRPSSAENTWSELIDPARTAPNSSAMSCRKWVRRTRPRVGTASVRTGARAGSPTVAGVDLLLLVVGQIDLHSAGPAWLWDAAGVLALVAVLVVLLRWWSSQRRR